MKTNENAIMICSIQKDDTDETLRNKMIEMESMLSSGLSKTGFLLSISGYENDSRELWQIPEVRKLTTRLVKIGFISLLEVATHLKSMIDPDPLYKSMLGAFEVWAISKGIIKSYYSKVTKGQYRLFLEVLSDANVECDKITKWSVKISE